MKIQCDACNKHEASLFCTADEAALCDGCDHRIHHANKLASKHQRLSLLSPSSKHQYPLCDVCQERRAFMFCKQDRAILCKECDLSIHSANEHTLKHDRFLLTGVKLSTPPNLSSSSTTKTPSKSKLPSAASSSASSPSNLPHPPSIAKTNIPSAASTLMSLPPTTLNKVTIEGTGSTTSASSISQYLIETLPGWQVEDFLDPCSVPFGFCKSDEVFDAGIGGNIGSLLPESMGIWVPQAPPALYSSQIMEGVIGQSEAKEAATTNIKGSSRTSTLRHDNNFTVPQISHDFNSKRPRYLW